jgi:hypothetical protein
MKPWYRTATPGKEVRQRRLLNADGFAIHLEQVIAGTAPVGGKSWAQIFLFF